MGRIYTLTLSEQTITNAGGDTELFYVAPADDKPVRIHSLYLSPASVGDLGDAAEETIRFSIFRGYSTVGSGGTAFTNSAVGRVNPTDADPSFVARFNDTTIASSGTPITLFSDKWNIRGNYPLVLPVEHRFLTTQAQGSLVVRIIAAPADDILISATLICEEDG